MSYDLDQISNKLDVHLHQLARSIEESRNNAEEAVEFFVATEELLKVLSSIGLGKYRDIVDIGINEEDKTIKSKACVIAASLISDLLNMTNHSVASKYFEHGDLKEEFASLLIEASDAVSSGYDELERDQLPLDATMMEDFDAEAIKDESESASEDLFEFDDNGEMIVKCNLHNFVLIGDKDSVGSSNKVKNEDIF